jgi:hypothetical protein
VQLSTADVDQTAGRRKPPSVTNEPCRLVRRSRYAEPENDDPGDGQRTHIKKCPMTGDRYLELVTDDPFDWRLMTA